MSTIELRSASSADVTAVVRVFQQARANGLPWLPVLHTPDEDLVFFGALIQTAHTTVALINDDVVGFAIFSDSVLRHLYVDPTWWSVGVGRTLLRQVMHERPDGFTLYTFEQNSRARRFYEYSGFRAIARSRDNEEQLPDVLYQWNGGSVERPDSYELRDGTRLRRAVRGVILDQDDRVLLGQWQRPEFERERWILPGGGVKVGETLHAALQRELNEETGLQVERPVPLIWILTTRVVGNPRWGGQINHVFYLRVQAFDPVPAMTEAELMAEHMVGLRWWTTEELAAEPDALGPRPVPALIDDLRRHGPPARPLVLDVRP